MFTVKSKTVLEAGHESSLFFFFFPGSCILTIGLWSYSCFLFAVKSLEFLSPHPLQEIWGMPVALRLGALLNPEKMVVELSLSTIRQQLPRIFRNTGWTCHHILHTVFSGICLSLSCPSGMIDWFDFIGFVAAPLQRRRWQSASSVMESRLKRREKPASKSSQFLLRRRLEGPGQQQIFSEEGAVMGSSKKAGGISTAVKQPGKTAKGPGLAETRGWCRKSRNRGKEFFHGCIFTGSISPGRTVALPLPYSNNLFRCICNQIKVADGSTANTDFVSVKPPGRWNDRTSS